MGFLKKLVAFLALTMPLSMVRSQAVSVDVYNYCQTDVSLDRIGYSTGTSFDCSMNFDYINLTPGQSTTVSWENTADGRGTMYMATGLDNSQILWSDGLTHTDIMKPRDGATDTNCEGQSFFDITQTDGKLFLCSTNPPAPHPDPVTTTIINNCATDMPVAGLYYDYTGGSYSFKCDSTHDDIVIPSFSYATVVSGKFGSMYVIGDGSIDNSYIMTNDGSSYDYIMPVDGATTDSTCDGVNHIDIAPANGGVLFLCSTDPTYAPTETRKLHRKNLK